MNDLLSGKDEKLETPRQSTGRSLRNTLWATVPLLLWAIYYWVRSIQRIARYYTPLPIWDYWRVAQFLKRYQAHDFSVLWQQHNEHRIIFPEIVFALDMLLFHGRQIFPVTVSVLCYAGIVAVLGWMIRIDGRLSAPVQAASILLGAIILGWQGNAVFLADTFLLQWTMLQFSVALSLALLTFARKPASHWTLPASLVFAEIAMFSSGNGMLLWPLLVLAALVLGLPRKRVWLLGAVAVVSLAVYFNGYVFLGNLHLKNFVLYPLYTLKFLGAYLCMPFGGMRAPMFGVYVGWAQIAVAIILFWVAARRRLLSEPVGAVFFGVYLFGVATALLTAAGRMDPLYDPRFSGAQPMRYLSMPLANWAVIVMLAIWVSGVRQWKLFSAPQLCAIAALLALMGFPKLRWWLQDRDVAFAERQLVTIASRNGIVDPNLILKVFPDPSLPVPLMPQLRNGHLSVFADRRYQLIGTPLRDTFKMLKQPGFGAVTYMHLVTGGIEVAGWVDASRDNENATEIVLVNESGIIAGFGTKLGNLFPDRLVGFGTPPSLGWVGFVNLTVRSHSFQPFFIRKHQLVSLGGPIQIPDITTMAPEQAGAPISGVQWTADPEGKDSGWSTHAELPGESWLGIAPLTAVHSSRRHWALTHWEGEGPKENGVLTARFSTPAGHCVVLPLLHGPAIEGLSVTVNDASVPLQNEEKIWTYVRIPVDGPTATVTFTAPFPDKWLAVAEPRECH